jgi:HEAT repeat protein
MAEAGGGPPLPPNAGGRSPLPGDRLSGEASAPPTSSSPQHWGAGGAAALAALRSPEAREREAALRWLGQHAPEALSLEHAMLFHDPDLGVRTAAAVVFRAAADAALANRARLALRELVLGNLPERHAGLRAAAELANPTLAPRLLHYLDDPDAETRRLTLLALAAIPPGLLVPDFLRLRAQAALNDPDAGVREAAENVLKMTNDE